MRMEGQWITIATGVLAAIIVMILHELPKSIVYYYMDQSRSKRSMKYALKLHHYIDPIGVIFCLIAYGGFSKPYMYRIKDKKLNCVLGITGFASLLILFASSVTILKYVFGMSYFNGAFQYTSTLGKFSLILMYLFFYLACFSFGMFCVNLFPIATFDMGNIIAGISPTKFFEYLRKDYTMKILLMFVLMFGIIAGIGEMVLSILLR